MTARQRIFRFIWPYLMACIALLITTYCGMILRVNVLTNSFLYLLLVLTIAVVYGFWQATFTALAAFALLDYYFTEPLYSLGIANAQDWLALVTFEVTALVVGRLSARELRNAREADIHRVGMQQLYELSRNSLLLDMRQPPGPQLIVLIQRIFNTQAVALFDMYLGRQDSAGDWGIGEENLAKQCYMRDTPADDLQKQTHERVLRTGVGSVGALAIQGKLNPLVVDALASLASLAIERHQSFENESRAESVKQREELRVAVLDALAHEFKTPLTAVQTASSGLLDLGELTEVQTEMIALIDEQAVRLTNLCTRLLKTAKLESEQFGLHTDVVNLQEIIHEVVRSRPSQRSANAIKIAMEEPNIHIHADRSLLALVLTEYIDNAQKYSKPGTVIEVAARKSRAEALISVKSFGPTIRMEDRERIFERFFRSSDAAERTSGTGIGLSVVKKAAAAHHGHVWVVSDAQEGTTFFLSLPEGTRRPL